MMHVHALRRAAEIMGGPDRLRAYLRVAMRDLETWMKGTDTPPTDVFLKVVDIISGQADAELSDLVRRCGEARGRATKAVQAAQAARERAAEIKTRAIAARQGSSELRAALLKGRIAEVASQPEITPEDFVAKEFAPSEGALILESALNAAVNGTAAQRANIQLVDRSGLRIVAHLGFQQPFLCFFDTVSHQTPSACGRAHELGQRAIVADVTSDPIFAGTLAGEVMRDAKALAVQSTPLIGGSDEVIGMFSTHYEKPHQPSPEELAAIDLICQRTSFWLTGHQSV